MKFFEICAKSNSKAPEVLLYGSISEWGKIRAVDFISNLRALESKHSEGIFRIHSGGGDVFEGLPIYHAVENSTMELTGIVDGLCASMMSVILQGFKTRKMVKGTRMMIHEGSTGAYGGVKKLRDRAKLLEALNKDMAEIFAKRTGKTADWILENWMKDGEDTWFSAEEAKKAGLIDEVIDGKVNEPSASEYTEIAAHYDQEIAANYDEQISTTNKPDMKKIAAKFGLAEDATEDQILAAIEAEKKANSEKGVKALVAMGVQKGFKKEVIEKLATANFDATLDLIEAEKPAGETPPVASTEQKPEADSTRLSDIVAEFRKSNSNGGEATPKKTLRELEKENPTAIKAMMKEKPEEYQKLYQAEYSAEISLEEIKKLAK